jgi:hypothetical protein
MKTKTKHTITISADDVKQIVRKHLQAPDTAQVEFRIQTVEKGVQWDPCSVHSVTEVEVTTWQEKEV